MNKEHLKTITSNPGIYCIRNKVNNKCYVGQALDLKKRLFTHLNAYTKENNQHIVIYKAINKYGINNFEVTIVKELEPIKDKIETKKELDILEVKFIKQFDSYNNGYNSTLGGDGGILGYKMTPEQIEKIRQASKENCINGIETTIVNINTKEEYTFKTITEAAQFIGTTRDVLGKRVRGETLLPINNFIPKQYYLEYVNNPNKLSDGKFKSLYTKEEFLELLSKFEGELTTSNLEEKLGITKKSFYNYLDRYEIKSPLNTHNSIAYYVLENTITKDLIKHTLDSLAAFFNISPSSMHKQCQRCTQGSLYKKIYKIHTVYTDYSSELHHYINKINGHTLTSIYDKLHLFNSFDDISMWEQID